MCTLFWYNTLWAAQSQFRKYSKMYFTVDFSMISIQDTDASELSWNFEALSSVQCGEINCLMSQHPAGHCPMCIVQWTFAILILPCIFSSNSNYVANVANKQTTFHLTNLNFTTSDSWMKVKETSSWWSTD